jgi:hypothetical protein
MVELAARRWICVWTMSGHLFPDVGPITLSELAELEPKLVTLLELAGAGQVTPVGSTGLKPVMGDIDLACNHLGLAEGLQDALPKRFQTKRVGTDLVSIRYPLDRKRWVQVDVMVGDVRFLSWARAGSQDPGIKGAARAVLLNAVMRYVSLMIFPPTDNELLRTRYVLDFGSGMYRVTQTKHSQRGSKLLKNWKTLDREKITDNPDSIVMRVFGNDVGAHATMSFSGVVNAMRQGPPWIDHLCWILPAIMREIQELDAEKPGTYGDLGAIASILKV